MGLPLPYRHSLPLHVTRRRYTRDPHAAMYHSALPTPTSIRPADYDAFGNNPRGWYVHGRMLLDSADLHREFGFVESFMVPASQPIPPHNPKQYRRRDDLGNITQFEPVVTVWPEWMLRGMAMECYLKGLWLTQGNTVCQGGKYRGVRPAGAKDKVDNHNLEALASAVQFALSPAEIEKPVQMWAFAMIGMGRYPIGPHANVLPSFPNIQIWGILIMEVLQLGDGLTQRLEATLKAALPALVTPPAQTQSAPPA